MEHDGCKGCLYESEQETSEHCTGCIQNAVDKYTPMTNADRIRNMSDEELAETIMCPFHSDGIGCIGKSCFGCSLKWLKEKVE